MLVPFSTRTGYYILSGAPGKTATVKITGGKMWLSVPAVTLYSLTGDQREVSASASE